MGSFETVQIEATVMCGSARCNSLESVITPTGPSAAPILMVRDFDILFDTQIKMNEIASNESVPFMVAEILAEEVLNVTLAAFASSAAGVSMQWPENAGFTGALATILSTVLVSLLGVLLRIVQQKKRRLENKLNALAFEGDGPSPETKEDVAAMYAPVSGAKADLKWRSVSYVDSVRRLVCKKNKI